MSRHQIKRNASRTHAVARASRWLQTLVERNRELTKRLPFDGKWPNRTTNAQRQILWDILIRYNKTLRSIDRRLKRRTLHQTPDVGEEIDEATRNNMTLYDYMPDILDNNNYNH
jgi:hypothetical protein